MLPYHYEMIILPNNLQKYYGYGQRFIDCYRVFLNYLIVRHRDHRVMGMGITGQPIVNRDSQYTYYHRKKKNILLEKILHLQKVQLFATPEFVNFLH